MRKRQKQVRKLLTFYKHNFGLNAPYKILIDGTFCKSALIFKVNISEQMPKYLGGEVNLMTTECVKAECEAFGTLLYGPLKILRQFEIHHCNHKKKKPAANCISSIVRKAGGRRLMVATQDEDLKEKLRDSPGIPLLFMAYNAINMERPSEVSKGTADKELQARIAPSQHEMEVLKKLKVQTFGEQPAKKKFKKKGPKEPNPLSCLKKSKKKGQATKPKKSFLESAIDKRKRQRKRKREKKLNNPSVTKELSAAVTSSQS